MSFYKWHWCWLVEKKFSLLFFFSLSLRLFSVACPTSHYILFKRYLKTNKYWTSIINYHCTSELFILFTFILSFFWEYFVSFFPGNLITILSRRKIKNIIWFTKEILFMYCVYSFYFVKTKRTTTFNLKSVLENFRT